MGFEVVRLKFNPAAHHDRFKLLFVVAFFFITLPRLLVYDEIPT